MKSRDAEQPKGDVSPKKIGTVGVLMKRLGIRRKEFADLLGYDDEYLKKILTRGILPRELAIRIVEETNVSYDWLMGGEPAAEITDLAGKPYRWRWKGPVPKSTPDLSASDIKTWEIELKWQTERIARCLIAALESNRHRQFLLKLKVFLETQEMNLELRPGKKKANAKAVALNATVEPKLSFMLEELEDEKAWSRIALRQSWAKHVSIRVAKGRHAGVTEFDLRWDQLQRSFREALNGLKNRRPGPKVWK
jgi:transcriptional regulator with XRE-family HTH domain